MNTTPIHPLVMTLNRVQLIGNLTKNPDSKETPSGKSLTKFCIATNHVWRNPKTKEKKENTQFHDIVTWGHTAQNAAKYLEKGRQVYVEGKLEHKFWEDENKKKHKQSEIIADNVIFLGKGLKNAPEDLAGTEVTINM